MNSSKLLKLRHLSVILAIALLFSLMTPYAALADTTDETGSETTAEAVKIKTGLYYVDGQWKYFENGVFKRVTGLVVRPDTKTYHYVVKGVFSPQTGMVMRVQPGNTKGQYYYVVDGNFSKATGLVKCIQPGKCRGKFYYVQRGRYTKVTGMVKCIQPGKSQGKWYYVIKGRQNKEITGMVKCAQPGESLNKWFYVEKGRLKNYTGLVTKPKKEQLYYVEEGKYNKFTGLIPRDDEKWFVRKGKAETRYTNSSMVEGTILSPNNFTRNGTPIKKITIHHMAGVMSAESCGIMFSKKSRSASSNYGIGKDGEVWQYVDEAIQSKCSVSRENDIQAITIEVSNDINRNPYTISKKNMKVLIKLCTDICLRNGIDELIFTGDATGNLTMHKYFYATGCPGPYLSEQFPYIAEQVNKRIKAAKKKQNAKV